MLRPLLPMLAGLLTLLLASRAARAGDWDVQLGFGYAQSLPLADSQRRVHLPVARLRLSRVSDQGWELGVEATYPLLLFVPHGQLSGGLLLGKRWVLGEAELEGIEPGRPTRRTVELSAAVGGGWTHVYSGVAIEGYLAEADDAATYHGPFGRGELGLAWCLHFDGRPIGGLSLGLTVGAAATHARFTKPDRLPSAWRLTLDALFSGGLRW